MNYEDNVKYLTQNIEEARRTVANLRKSKNRQWSTKKIEDFTLQAHRACLLMEWTWNYRWTPILAQTQRELSNELLEGAVYIFSRMNQKEHAAEWARRIRSNMEVPTSEDQGEERSQSGAGSLKPPLDNEDPLEGQREERIQENEEGISSLPDEQTPPPQLDLALMAADGVAQPPRPPPITPTQGSLEGVWVPLEWVKYQERKVKAGSLEAPFDNGNPLKDENKNPIREGEKGTNLVLNEHPKLANIKKRIQGAQRRKRKQRANSQRLDRIEKMLEYLVQQTTGLQTTKPMFTAQCEEQPGNLQTSPSSSEGKQEE